MIPIIFSFMGFTGGLYLNGGWSEYSVMECGKNYASVGPLYFETRLYVAKHLPKTEPVWYHTTYRVPLIPAKLQINIRDTFKLGYKFARTNEVNLGFLRFNLWRIY